MKEEKEKKRVGRPPGSTSSRSLRQNRLKEVLNQVNPILAKALKKAEQILDADLTSKDVSATTQLQAAKLVIEKAIDLRNEVYGKEKDQVADPSDEESEELGAVLSFVIPENRK
jgi:hypothetical protein